MFICLECEHIFEAPKSFKESRGECFGIPAFETMYGCPRCAGDYEEIRGDGNEICEMCGVELHPEELRDGLCAIRWEYDPDRHGDFNTYYRLKGGDI